MNRWLPLLILLTSPAWADPVLVAGFPQTKTQSSGTSAQTAGSFSVASTDLLFVCGSTFGTAMSVASVGGTGGTVTWTQLVTVNNTTISTLWEGVPSASITGLDVKISWTGTTDGAIAVYDYSAASVSCAAPNGCNTATSGSGAATVNVSGTLSGSRMIGCASQGTDATSWTPNAGFTADVNFIPSDSFLSMHSTSDTTGSNPVTVGTSAPTGKQWVMAAVEVRATGGAAAATPTLMLMGVGQ